MFGNRSRPRLGLLLVLGVALVSLAFPENAFAGWCWWYNVLTGNNPQPWAFNNTNYPPGVCDFTGSDIPDPGAQQIGHTHRNFHCANPPASTTAYGRAFLAFHRQFIVDYDVYRINNSLTDSNGILLGRLETWEPDQGTMVPGDDEILGQAFTHCSSGSGRPAGMICNNCQDLPCHFRVAPGGGCLGPGGETKLGDFTSLGAVGAALEVEGWHGSYHNGVRVLGCTDIGGFLHTPRDPAFWMAHKQLDEISRDWQQLKACDVVIVLDVSGSMNDNCPGSTDCGTAVNPGDLACKLNAAKEAARTFADLVQDVRMEGGVPAAQQHRIGLVTFATTATPQMGLTTANGILPALDAILAGIDTPCGATSIGDGVREAINMLNSVGSPNPHQAILILSDGKENTEPCLGDGSDGQCASPSDVVSAGELGEIQVCAIGYGLGAEEDNLRKVAERHGGVFVADPDLSPSGLSLQKFFVDCFGQIFDSTIAEDPIVTLPAGAVSSGPILTEICGTDSQLTYVIGREPIGQGECDLRLIVETPGGDLVDLSEPGVETGHGSTWDFIRIALPYRGESAGTWTAYAVRPQRIFTHGFVTDGFGDIDEGTALVRREIHRLCPTGCERVLYYEDGSVTGESAYRRALELEKAAGTIGEVLATVDPDEFGSLLEERWDLVVFARQLKPEPQVFDSILAEKLCEGQKALITDFFFGLAGANPILRCAGVRPGENSNYQTLVGDGTLVSGTIKLANPGYNLFSFELIPVTSGGLWRIHARNELRGGAVVGTGSSCPDQDFFYSSLVRGFGRVHPFVRQPRVMLGHKILATFRITASNRPVDDWDAVTAIVTLRRPGGGALETYPLFDDGTNGDRSPNNHFWSVEIPSPATRTGPHLLSAKFDLTKGGCTIHREAEYSILVTPEPEDCSPRLTCARVLSSLGGDTVVPGGILHLELACVANLCSEPDSYRVQVRDTQGWLCAPNDEGKLEPLGEAGYRTEETDPGRGICLFEEVFPLHLCIPPDAELGETTVITHEVLSLTTGQTATCETTVEVSVPNPTPDDVRFRVDPLDPPGRPGPERNGLIPWELEIPAGTDSVSVMAGVYLASNLAGFGHHGDTLDGVQAWSLSVVADDCFDITDATTAGTAGADVMDDPPGLRNNGLESTEIVDPARNNGRQGAVSAVILSQDRGVTLPPTGEELVLLVKGDIDASTVQEPGQMTDFCTIRPANPGEPGLIGSAKEVRTVVTIDDQSVVPAVRGATVKITGVTSTLQVPGDCNQDGQVDLSDPTCLFNFLFIGVIRRLPCGNGTSLDPSNTRLMDWNGDGLIDISDGVAALTYLFLPGGLQHVLGGECTTIAGCPDSCI